MPMWAWILIAAVVVVWTTGSFGVWPFANCRRCQGKGRWRNPNPTQPFRHQLETGVVTDKWIWCSVCHGTGRRLTWKRYR